MLKYYSVPGKLLAEFWFLWSKKGQLWGSARRRDHPFVHFFYSTIIYAITAFAVFVWMADWETPRREGENQSEYTAAIDPSPGEIISPEADEPESVADEAPADEAQEFPAIADDHKTQGSAVTSSAPGNEIRSAMTSAFETGQPVRWEGEGVKGYAVPSEAEASSGCRQVYYSEDDRPGWTSPPETICP